MNVRQACREFLQLETMSFGLVVIACLILTHRL